MVTRDEVEIREERPEDAEAIRRVVTEAFGQPDEGRIVDALRSACPDRLSLVAVDVDTGEPVGHILFTPATLETIEGMGLAPMAVASDRQRHGIGSRLIRSGVDTLRARGCPFVIVLGHAEYYPRFGFERASVYGVRCKWDVPDDVFMILRLDPTALEGVTGTAYYRDEFG